MARAWTGVLLLTCFILYGCQKPLTDAEKASAAAQIEAAQHAKPPPEPIDLQRITAADIEQNRLYVPGCSFVPDATPGGDPVVIAASEGAVVKIAGRMVTFAADVGGTRLGTAAWIHYTGKAQSIRFDPGSGSSGLGTDGVTQPARLTLSDAYDRVVWSGGGMLVCGPGRPADHAIEPTAPE